MIEFTPDGPFAEKADPLFPDRVRLVGLGQTGVAVCDQIVLHGRPGLDLWAFDSDQQLIDSSVVPNKYLLGRNLVHGLGCNGDLELAREIVALEENQLAHLSHGCDFLVLVLGLAGSTGVALAEHLMQKARENGIKVIVVGAQPFAFEGWSRREKSIATLAQFRQEADSVLVLSHDRLAENPDVLKNVRHGFHLMNQILAQTAQALTQIVCKRGLIQLSFADVRSLYGRYAGAEVLENCWAGHVEGDIHEGTEDLIESLLQSPLLSDESIWKQVDHAIVAVSGTANLGLSDVQELVGALKERLPANIPIATSASLDDEHHDKVRLTVLLATTTPVPVLPIEEPVAEERPAARQAKPGVATVPLPKLAPPQKLLPKVEAPAKKEATVSLPMPRKVQPLPAPVQPMMIEDTEPAAEPQPEAGPIPELPPKPTRRGETKQEEMHFEAPTRGRFEKTHETMYRGENLDQPTFRRRGLVIKL